MGKGIKQSSYSVGVLPFLCITSLSTHKPGANEKKYSKKEIGKALRFDMEKEIFILRSSILPTLMRKKLVQGTILAGIGVVILLWAGVFLPLAKMKVWGPFLFFLSLGLIAWGLFPYKKLKRLEERPYRLDTEGDWLHFSSAERSLFSIPLISIAHIAYLNKGDSYGMGIFLKTPIPQKIAICDPSFNIETFIQKSKKNYGCDLFLQYFSQRSCNSLQSFQNRIFG